MKLARHILFRVIKSPADQLGLTASSKAVLLALMECLNPEKNGSLAWPSQKTLAVSTGISDKSVRRQLNELQRLDLIKKQKDNDQRFNTYSVNVGLINRLINTGHGDRYTHEIEADTGHGDRCIPVTVTGGTGHGVPLTTNRTTKENSEDFPFRRSASPKVIDRPVQQQLAVHGLVTGAADKMRLNDDERRKEEKAEDPQQLWGGRKS